MPGSVLKSGLVYDTDAMAKGIECVGDSFRQWNVARDFNNFEALGISEVAEVRLLVPGSQFSQKFNAGILKEGLLNLPRCLGMVERQEVMAG